MESLHAVISYAHKSHHHAHMLHVCSWHPGSYGRLTLKLPGFEQGLLMGSCKHGKDTSRFIKGNKFLHRLRDYQVFKKDCPACSYNI